MEHANLPKRQQTIRNTIEWSFELLSDDEQHFLARLGVFSGGRSLAAIEGVCIEDLAFDAFEGVESSAQQKFAVPKRRF